MKSMSLTFLLFATPGFAHVPFVEGLDYQDNEAYQVQDPVEKSLALYMSFNGPDDLDRVQFTLSPADFQDAKAVVDAKGRRGRKVTFHTIVPACKAYASILPYVALIGPKQELLPEWSSEIALPFALDADQGVYLIRNSEQGAAFEEKITKTAYYQQKSAELIISTTGRYELVVWEPKGQIADYVLVFGDEEIFGPEEIQQANKHLDSLLEGQEIKNLECRQQLKPQSPDQS